MRRQIVLHYILVVFVALLLVETTFLLAIRTYYYDSIYTKITTQISAAESMVKYGVLNGTSANQLKGLLDYFNLEYTELEVLTLKGDILTSTTGFQPDRTITTSDVPEAVGGSIGRWLGRQAGTNESVMAVSKMVRINAHDTYILRYLTSMEGVNKDLLNLTLLSIGIGVVVLTIVLLLSFGLANSIVRPLNNITAVSAQMAKGKFTTRIKGDYRYEIGELASTLNYMADEIVRSNQIKDDFISSISHEPAHSADQHQGLERDPGLRRL